MLVKLHREMKNVHQSSFSSFLSKVVILDKSELPQKMLKLGNLRGKRYMFAYLATNVMFTLQSYTIVSQFVAFHGEKNKDCHNRDKR